MTANLIHKKVKRFPVRRKISFSLNFISRFLRIFVRNKPGICFVLDTKKPWGCNLEALLCYVLNETDRKHIYILNFGGLPLDFFTGEYGGDGRIKVINPQKFFQTLFCIVFSKMFFVNDYSHFRLPGPVVNLWHGIPLKNIGTFQSKKFKKLSRRFDKVLSARSQFDKHNMALAFGMEPCKILDAGLPRHDWICGTVKPPTRYREAASRLRRELKGRKLVLYAPTFRDENRYELPITNEDLNKWADWLSARNFALGVRGHVIADTPLQSRHPNIISLSGKEYHHVEALFELTDILVTDYSSLCVDFMITDKPIVGLDLSKARYSRGFLLDFNLLFPGNFYQDLDLFLEYLDSVCSGGVNTDNYGFSKKMFLGDYNGDACINVFKSLI